MAPSVALQAAQFAAACAMGAILGGIYDMLRGLRRSLPRLTGLCDLLFGTAAILGLLALALYPGQGQFRLFFFPGAILGAWTYFRCLSRLLLPLWKLFWLPAAFFLRKMRFFCKKSFAFLEKWYTIRSTKCQEQGEKVNEAKKLSFHRLENRRPVPAGVRGLHHGNAESPDP